MCVCVCECVVLVVVVVVVVVCLCVSVYVCVRAFVRVCVCAPESPAADGPRAAGRLRRRVRAGHVGMGSGRRAGVGGAGDGGPGVAGVTQRAGLAVARAAQIYSSSDSGALKGEPSARSVPVLAAAAAAAGAGPGWPGPSRLHGFVA